MVEKQSNINCQEQEKLYSDKLILVVDDVNLMCHFLYETLKPLQGLEIRTTGDFSAAESILTNAKIDLAIIDIHLKDTSGLLLAKKIREGRYLCRHDIPILIFSGNTYKKEIKMCLAYDVTDIMAKPLAASTVRKRVLNALNKDIHLRGPEYYQALVSSDGESYKTEFSGPVVKSESPRKVRKQAMNISSEEEVEKNSFIKWPEDLTSGYHQIDRRLKHITYLINMLHYRKRATEKYPNIAEDVKNIRLALDDLLGGLH